MNSQTKIYYTDAGTKNNGKFGYQETRIVICNDTGTVIHEEEIGDKTCNEGEVTALIWAMDNLPRPLHLMCDSQLAVNWAKGSYKTKIERLKPLIKKLRLALAESEADLEWIPREFNLAGHYIEEKYGL